MKLPYRTEANARAIAKVWNKPLDKPDWWKVEASTDDAEEILIYDFIGWPFNDPYELNQHLKSLNGKDVTFRINSPGGDVFDGLTIFSAMREYKGRITTKIEGMAASMASVIALGGGEVQAHKHAMYMIHEPLVLTIGNQHELREVADILQKISVNFVDIYSEKAGGKKRDIQQKMKDETWFSAKEAKEYGFIDTVLDLPAARAGFDLSVFANVPQGWTQAREKRELEQRLRDEGYSSSDAKAEVARRFSGGGNQRDAESVKLENAILKTILKMRG